ncbi:ATP-grasp domain-containing protein [Paracidovorax konjaci]|uniref:ATP-grasp domain-containing protein n=1 Tax=Paracidovorax konjaci TaxID=32040 RepID=A0A1I1Z678_9BURK|nr:carboxylate--amine ligase [Paracidovorax konjaci]SFE26798.1 hypothetical protein SAMN04489710_12320 [Paracidovorax konjaci]
MNILILHRIPYRTAEYHRGIDHSRHDVTYFGTEAALATVPAGLRCQKVARPGMGSVDDEARAWLGERPAGFDRVIALAEKDRLEAARLREWLGVAGPSAEQVTAARNKIAMKRAVAQAGLKVPRFLPLPDFLALRDAPPWRGKTILKPQSGAASEDVAVFDSTVAARAAVLGFCSGIPRLDALQAADACGDFEVEEYLEGPVLHFDGVAIGGRTVALTASRYLNTCLDYARGRPLGSMHIPLTDTARRWVARALESLALHDGCFHLEAIGHQGELAFLEIDNPVDVAQAVTTFELATDVHLPSVELKLMLGEDPGSAVRRSPEAGAEPRWHGWFAVPGHHLGRSVHAGLGGIAMFRRSEAVLRWHELPAGAPLPERISYQTQEVPLAGIVATAGPPQTQAWIESLFTALRWIPAPAVAASAADEIDHELHVQA